MTVFPAHRILVDQRKSLVSTLSRSRLPLCSSMTVLDHLESEFVRSAYITLERARERKEWRNRVRHERLSFPEEV